LLGDVTVNPDIDVSDLLNDLSAKVLAGRGLLKGVTISPPIDISDVLTKKSLLEDVTVSPPVDVSDVANDLDLDVLTKKRYVGFLSIRQQRV